MEPQISQITQKNKRDPLSYDIIGAAMEVHRELGPGFLEAVYQEAMEIELRERKMPFISQPRVKLHYKQFSMDKYYIPDFICFDTYVVEIKAESNMTVVDEAQIINVLKASRLQTGLLINFEQPSLKYKRFIYT
ncbi:MAG: GxxExxY protein [Planctomycetota bacterium]|nr:MAG: GxxExxY protein [Planctomycetota bacterium]RKY13941.1 MAG: GxxExxY protein [Planctomycetota bacterium]